MNKSEDLIEYVKDRPGHDRRYSVDWTKINKDLNWKPSVTLEEGMQKTIDWYLDNHTWWQPLLENSADFFDKNYNSKK